ncbi:MAG TPA: hypothetical protein VK203_09910 [Nostocaceae cyanobacterium]|nr:hypothetical protein [Nostocaceae cyanobacterium]
MKRYFTNIFILASLLLAAGCSSTVKSSEAKVSDESKVATSVNMHHGNHQEQAKSNSNEKSNVHTDHDEHGNHNEESSSHNHHDEHGNDTNHNKITTKAKLTTPKNLAAKEPVNLVIDIQDLQGKPVNKFDVFQEKLMHLIVVSDDLRFFDHLHPDYKNNGRFEVSANFPESGNYTFFSDYKPTGQKETISLLNVKVPGSVPLPKDLEKFEKTKTISDVKVSLNVAQKEIKAGQEISLKFDVKDAKSNQVIKDLQPYLGEKGHLVIIKSSLPLTRNDYIHAHALQNSADGQIDFMTKFPQRGTYKMWLQFNRGGQIKTADFWVNVV